MQADLTINTEDEHNMLKSDEGSIQGEVAAMAFSALVQNHC